MKSDDDREQAVAEMCVLVPVLLPAVAAGAGSG